MTAGSAAARVLVTGANGYLGRHVLRQCLERNIEAAALLRTGWAADITGDATPILLSDPDWRDRIAGFAPDTILHIAAWSGMLHGPGDVDPIIDANIRLGTQLLELGAGMTKPPAFVWAGSFWQYGDGGRDYAPNSLYAASKQAFGAIVEYYRRMRGMRCLGLILHDIYGEDDPRPRLLGLIAATLGGRGGALDLTDGTQHISFVHVDDAARAFLHAAELLHADDAAPADTVYSVAGGEAGPLREQIDALLQPGDDASRLRWGLRPHAAGAVRDLTGLPALPGWRPLIPLGEGFERLRRHV